MNLLSLFRRNTFNHGVHPPDHKEATCSLPIRRLPFAPQLLVPLSQHRGAPAKSLVHPGQEVVRGELIAAADGFMSVPMHAPATGRVRGLERVTTADGQKTEAIVLDVYQGCHQAVQDETPCDPYGMTLDELMRAVQATGMVGQGGAAFPSHVKLKVPAGQVIDTLVVNGCECEPFLTCDHRIMLEQTDQLVAGIRMVMAALWVHRAMIGIEDNKPDAIAALRARIPEGSGISVHAMETKYPQGAEKMVIEALLHRTVPSGGLPSNVGVVVFNVGTLAQLGTLLPRGQGLIERVVTISGPGVERPGNYLVPIGTPLRFLLDHVGARPDAHEVILGGPMMGQAVASLDIPVTKAMSGVVVLASDDADLTPRKILPCIRCARCVDACPIHLNPSMLGQLAGKRRYHAMVEEYHLLDCFECGCCSYVCPSNIPLVQQFRVAKAMHREQAA
jgi:Na+-translocating ferredoxin:NAD+ oxidoreductase subunit C